MTFRRAVEADLPGEYDVFVAAQGELWGRHGLAWSASPFEAWSAPHRHLLDEDGERSFVAVDGERVVGFSAALARGDAWHFSALFVHPEYQARRIGKELLERSWGGGYRRRMTITDSIQPISTGLYAARGLVPTTPILVLAGRPSGDAPGCIEPVDPVPEAMASIDRSAYGFDRAPDHRYWREQSAASTLWVRGGEPVAYSYVGTQGLIGPLAGRDAEGAAGALSAELARRDGAETMVLIPGTSRRLVEIALRSGLRFARAPGLLLMSEECVPPDALAISSYWLL